jgi:hypothetical protein
MPPAPICAPELSRTKTHRELRPKSNYPQRQSRAAMPDEDTKFARKPFGTKALVQIGLMLVTCRDQKRRKIAIAKRHIRGRSECNKSRQRVIGGQGWIRTSVRKTGQIYSLLPLTTRPPVHFFDGALCQSIRAGPDEEAAQWRNGPCLSMPQVGKGPISSSFSSTGVSNVFP